MLINKVKLLHMEGYIHKLCTLQLSGMCQAFEEKLCVLFN